MANFELKKHLNIRKVCAILYIVAFLTYLIIGLQPASATEEYTISGELSIPSIELTSDVTDIQLENDALPVPATIVGAFKNAKNKTFLVGHSSTVFQNLKNVRLGDQIYYGEKIYTITNYVVSQKSEISMAALLSEAKDDTLIIMTCAGENLPNQDATHRLIIAAIAE